MGTFGCSPSGRSLAENVQMCVHIYPPSHTHTLYYAPSFSFRHYCTPNSHLEPILSPLPWSLLTSHYRLYFTPSTTYRFKNALHLSWFPICISQVISCKQKKPLCVDLSSSGIYWETLSTQNGQFQEADRNKERQHSQNLGKFMPQQQCSEGIWCSGAYDSHVEDRCYCCVPLPGWMSLVTKPQSHASTIAAREAEKWVMVVFKIGILEQQKFIVSQIWRPWVQS